LQLHFEPYEDLFDMPTVYADVDGGGRFGFGVDPDDDPAVFAVVVACHLGDQLPDRKPLWARALPPCPGHPHPALAQLTDERAWWVCPQGSGRLAPFGELSRVDPPLAGSRRQPQRR
jgi:hypothetical protein